jgi:hypothetical protein
MLIDCERCPVRGAGCGDCVVSVLLDRPPEPIDLDPAERLALRRLARAGLVPPLRPADRSAQIDAGSASA